PATTTLTSKPTASTTTPRTASRRSPARRVPPTWRDGAWTSPLPWRTPWPAPLTEILTTPPGPHPPPGPTTPPRPHPPPGPTTPPRPHPPPRPTTPPRPHPPPRCFPGWDLRSPAP